MAERVWIARHASRLDFEDRDWAARAARPHDPPLSARGRGEAEALARRLAGEPIAHLFCSPFLRCLETAQPVARQLGVAIRVEVGLSEWLNCAWFPAPPVLLAPEERAVRFPEVEPAYASLGAARHGESGEEALARAAATAHRLVEAFAGELLLVGHGASVMGAVAGLLGIAPAEVGVQIPDPRNGSLWRLAAAASGWQVELRGDDAHLQGG